MECVNCHLIRLHPTPPPQELATYYPASYWFAPAPDAVSRAAEWYRRIVLRDHVNFVAQSLAAARLTGPVLDVGCGGGLFGRMLGERGWHVLGLDYSREAAATAWRVNRLPVVCGDLSRPPLPGGSFGAVTMFHVLEHLYDPAAYIRAAHDLLLPGGRLIVQVPNADCWQFRVIGRRWNGLDIPRHLTNFRTRDIHVLLEQCGLIVLNTKHFSLRDNPAGLATSLAPALDPMGRRIRRVRESPAVSLAKDAMYFALVLASLPFTLGEAACSAGSTVMIEAGKPE